MSQHVDSAQASGCRTKADARALNPDASRTAKPDRAAEERRTRTLQMLKETQSLRYALVVDPEAIREAVIVAMAIRTAQGEVATCELRIPRDKYDPFVFLEALERDTRH